MRAAAEAELARRATFPQGSADLRIPCGNGAGSVPPVLRFLTAGESHGQGLVVIVEGLPAGLAVTVEDIQGELARRRLGYGRGPRQRFEVDELTLIGGVRHGRTLGSPVAIEIANTEWKRSDKWHAEMSPAPGATEAPLTQVRPGHADLAGMQKYGFNDARDVLERASARETAARVAAGAVAKLLLRTIGIEVISHVVQMGAGAQLAVGGRRRPTSTTVDESPVRCFDPDGSRGDGRRGQGGGQGRRLARRRRRGARLRRARRAGQPRPLGPQARRPARPGGDEHPGGQGRRDRRRLRRRRPARAAPPTTRSAGTRTPATYRRDTTLAGGVEGGMSTGELLVVRAAMKPLATLNVPVLETVDTATKEATVSFKERTDVTAVPAMGVVAETMVALVLAAEAQRKFGGDSVDEFVRNAEAFRATSCPRESCATIAVTVARRADATTCTSVPGRSLALPDLVPAAGQARSPSSPRPAIPFAGAVVALLGDRARSCASTSAPARRASRWSPSSTSRGRSPASA